MYYGSPASSTTTESGKTKLKGSTTLAHAGISKVRCAPASSLYTIWQGSADDYFAEQALEQKRKKPVRLVLELVPYVQETNGEGPDLVPNLRIPGKRYAAPSQLWGRLFKRATANMGCLACAMCGKNQSTAKKDAGQPVVEGQKFSSK